MLVTDNMGVLGDFNMDAFWDQKQESWLLALFVLLTAIVQIVLLNLLIALMGSIYEKEQEHSSNHRRAERASMILGAYVACTLTLTFFVHSFRTLRGDFLSLIKYVCDFCLVWCCLCAEIEAKMSEEDRNSPDFFPEHLHVLREKLDASRRTVRTHAMDAHRNLIYRVCLERYLKRLLGVSRRISTTISYHHHRRQRSPPSNRTQHTQHSTRTGRMPLRLRWLV